MSAQHDARRASFAHAPRRVPLSRRAWFWIVIVVIALVLFVVVWVGLRALQAKSDLQSAIPLVSKLKSQILAQDISGAKKTLGVLRPRTREARELTSDPVWRGAEIVPVAGKNLAAVRQLAGITDNVVTGAVAPLIDVAGSISPASIKKPDGSINVAPLVAITPRLDAASRTLTSSSRAAGEVDTRGTISQISSATRQLRTMLGGLAPQLAEGAKVLHVIPGALGSNHPRNYLVVFQNNGEALPNGGTTGSMALIQIDKGKISIKKQSSASLRDFPRFETPVIPLSPAEKALYIGLGKQVQDLTETPRFDRSFAVAKAMWKSAKADDIDGIIGLDTVAVSYLLRATGPIRLIDGTVLTSNNAVKWILGDIYEKHGPAEVDAINQAMAITTFSKLTSGSTNVASLATVLLQAAEQRRILIWTDNAAEQALIKGSSFDGAPPMSTTTTDAFGVYFRDQTPSKMDYYLRQKVTLRQAQCKPGSNRNVSVTVALTNSRPAAAALLPQYVTGDGRITPLGWIRTGVVLYAPPGYRVAGVTVDGRKASTIVTKDGDYPAVNASLLTSPGKTGSVTFDLVANSAKNRSLTAEATPVVAATTVTSGTLDCKGVAK